MEGPTYRYFRDAVESLMCEFCRNCEVVRCGEDYPASPDCPFHDKWTAIYNDFDQLLARVMETKEAV